MINLIYPVGSVYISTVNTNPGTLFGIGTWERYGNGKALVGVDEDDTDFSTVSKSGGEKQHKLSSQELPQHTHTIPSHTHTVSAHTHSMSNHTHFFNPGGEYHTFTWGAAKNNNVVKFEAVINGATGIVQASSEGTTVGTQIFFNQGQSNRTLGPESNVTGSAGGGNTGAYSGTSGAAGSSSSHNNLQPYITCYIWKRTA